mmetsp:Transcript_30870/g.91730  ORF Transcript_30870/g.91730 Transcript_30870/m.91730 type:complete len:236 (+) Transcript_30870:483-1190(+)
MGGVGPRRKPQCVSRPLRLAYQRRPARPPAPASRAARYPPSGDPLCAHRLQRSAGSSSRLPRGVRLKLRLLPNCQERRLLSLPRRAQAGDELLELCLATGRGAPASGAAQSGGVAACHRAHRTVEAQPGRSPGGRLVARWAGCGSRGARGGRRYAAARLRELAMGPAVQVFQPPGEARPRGGNQGVREGDAARARVCLAALRAGQPRDGERAARRGAAALQAGGEPEPGRGALPQ